MSEDGRLIFEDLVQSYGLSTSRTGPEGKGNYVNEEVQRQWDWFKKGWKESHVYYAQE